MVREALVASSLPVPKSLFDRCFPNILGMTQLSTASAVVGIPELCDPNRARELRLTQTLGSTL